MNAARPARSGSRHRGSAGRTCPPSWTPQVPALISRPLSRLVVAYPGNGCGGFATATLSTHASISPVLCDNVRTRNVLHTWGSRSHPKDLPGRARASGNGDGVAGEPDWVPPGVDTKRANIARVYDYWLGGSHNFLADQDLARAMRAVEPIFRAGARANRAFLGRAVRYLASAGIRQFLDIGSGIPTQGNVHEVAQQADPGSRVVYADIDPVAIAHSKAILAGHDRRRHHRGRPAQAGENPGRSHRPAADRLRPADRADPSPCVAFRRRQRGPLADRGDAARRTRPRQLPGTEPPQQREQAGEGTGHGVRVHPERSHWRAHALAGRDLRFFDGFELLDPGLVYIPQWRPDSPSDVPDDPSRFWVMVGVGRKPLP